MSDILALIDILIQNDLLIPAAIVIVVSFAAFPMLRMIAARVASARAIREYNAMMSESMQSTAETMRRVSDMNRQFAEAIGDRAEFEAQMRQLSLLNQELNRDLSSMQRSMSDLIALTRQASSILRDALDAATEAAILLDRVSVMIEKTSPCDDSESSQGDVR